MNRTNALLSCVTALSLPLAACSGNGEESDSDSNSASSTGINVTVSGTTTMGTTGTTTMSTSSETTTASSESETATTGPECVSNDDCSDGFICAEGSCEFDPSDCGEATIQIPITTPNVMLVLDKSGSMVSNSWDGDADPNTPDVTRWYSLYNVVEFIAASFNDSMNLGMVLFPSKKAKSEYNENACLVEVAPDVPTAPTNGPTILATMPPETATSQIQGGTPTRAGMITALSHLQSLADGLPQYIILVTDGAANCSLEAADNNERFEVYDAALAGVVSDAFTNGIPVFVVGIDIQNLESEVKQDGNPDATNTYNELNALAIAGGVPKNDPNEQFYNAQNQIELQDALTAISQQVLSCVIDLEPAPKYPDFVEVKVDDMNYGKMQVTDCANEDGWMFSNPEKTQITLCGAACDKFQTTGNIDAQYKCPGSG
ncbi:MAG: vWA domain-containing protein [Nannocystaceae bacterium]